MNDPLLDAQRRIQRAWSVDGLSELAAGLLFLVPALLEAAKGSHLPRSAAWQTLNTIQMLVIFPGVWVAIWVLPRLRNRIFGERAGIMIPRMAPEGRSKAMAIVAIGAMTAIVAALALKKLSFAAVTVVLGFGVGALFLRTGLSAGIRRYPVMGALVAAASIFIALQASTFESAFTWQMGFVGALCTATGAWTLLRFLRHRA